MICEVVINGGMVKVALSWTTRLELRYVTIGEMEYILNG